MGSGGNSSEAGEPDQRTDWAAAENTATHHAIPEHEDCVLLLDNLPRRVPCTYRELFDAISGFAPVGRIVQACIYDYEHYQSRRGKGWLQFFEARDAKRLLDIAKSGNFVIRGRMVHVFHGPGGRPDYEGLNSMIGSRVVVIAGPRDIVNVEHLCAVFFNHFDWQLDRIIVREEIGATRVLEWRFGSYRSQAEPAVRVLKEIYGSVLSIWFETDPCARPPGTSVQLPMDDD